VISAILNVAQSLENPWPLEVIGHDGVAVNVTMEPGTMVLYESHSVIHGRPFPMQGECYANLFLHFEPIGYSLELERKLAKRLPPAKELFEQALSRQTPDRPFAARSNSRANSDRVPSHIQEGTLAATRWRQEFVFHRDPETNEAAATKPVENIKGVTNAHRLAALGNIEGLRQLSVSNPEKLNEADANGWKPLHEAARAGKSEVIELILQQDNVDERTNDGDGGSPLWWAEHVLDPDHEAIAVLRRNGGIAVAPNE
jgi:prolyl 4-hydroxylase